MSVKTKAHKKGKLRNTEYYNLQEIQDELYAQSLNGNDFKHLMKIVCMEENIKLAYRNIKNNSGSRTPGTDGKTIKNIAVWTEQQLVAYVQRRLAKYVPQPVRRKEIEKPNGGIRPLGIPTIADRLIQQCVLQVLEPICEAKFHERNNGFRPNRSCENALAQAYKYMQQLDLHYVVDIDIKGFFDNVSHAKLLKQMWTLGIRDKSLLSIISRMLKAEVAGIGFPEKGTPQGGIISPLLSNIVLNELDWWVASQWEEVPTRYPYGGYILDNGTINKGYKYKALRKTSALKECFIVRYADDFKIFCRSHQDATRIFAATEMWLKERLGLSISPEKSQIVNLRKNYSEFLGFKLKMRKKGAKYIVLSQIGGKALKRIQDDSKKLINNMQNPKDIMDTQKRVSRYNAWVLGVQNYYRFATNVQTNLDPIAFRSRKNLEVRLKGRLSKKPKVKVTQYIAKRFGQSGQLRYVGEIPILPLGYVQHKNPMYKRKLANNYTEEGRKLLHKDLSVQIMIGLNYLLRHPVTTRSVEYNDNRLSLYSGQLGKCAVSGNLLELQSCEVHHKIPVSMGGRDDYINLIMVAADMHKLIHATREDTIRYYLSKFHLNTKQLQKLNNLRSLMKLNKINVA